MTFCMGALTFLKVDISCMSVFYTVSAVSFNYDDAVRLSGNNKDMICVTELLSHY